MDPLQEMCDAKNKIEKAELYVREFKLVLVGLALGVVGNLWANLLWELFRGYEFKFFIILILITALVFIYIFKDILNLLDSIMNGNSILKKKWGALKIARTSNKFAHAWVPQILGGSLGLILFSLAVYFWYPSLISDLWLGLENVLKQQGSNIVPDCQLISTDIP